LEDLGVDGRIILNFVFKKWDGSMEYTAVARNWAEVVVACECGNELSGSIKCGEILD